MGFVFSFSFFAGERFLFWTMRTGPTGWAKIGSSIYTGRAAPAVTEIHVNRKNRPAGGA
jgi:hypothetical protein